MSNTDGNTPQHEVTRTLGFRLLGASTLWFGVLIYPFALIGWLMERFARDSILYWPYIGLGAALTVIAFLYSMHYMVFVFLGRTAKWIAIFPLALLDLLLAGMAVAFLLKLVGLLWVRPRLGSPRV